MPGGHGPFALVERTVATRVTRGGPGTFVEDARRVVSRAWAGKR